MRCFLCTISALLLFMFLLKGQSHQFFVSTIQMAGAGIKSPSESPAPGTVNPSTPLPAGHLWQLHVNAEQRYISDIRTASIGFSYALSERGHLSLFYGQHGIDGFSFHRASVGSTLRLGHSLYAGSQFHMKYRRTDGYNTVYGVDVDVGFLYKSKCIDWSFTAGSQNLETDKADYPYYAAMAVQLNLNQVTVLFMEWEMNSHHADTAKAGLMYRPDARIGFIMGVRSKPASPSAGIRVSITDRLEMHAGFHAHPVLGPVFGFGLVLAGNK